MEASTAKAPPPAKAAEPTKPGPMPLDQFMRRFYAGRKVREGTYDFCGCCAGYVIEKAGKPLEHMYGYPLAQLQDKEAIFLGVDHTPEEIIAKAGLTGDNVHTFSVTDDETGKTHTIAWKDQ
jgi:hypothetical protein